MGDVLIWNTQGAKSSGLTWNGRELRDECGANPWEFNGSTLSKNCGSSWDWNGQTLCPRGGNSSDGWFWDGRYFYRTKQSPGSGWELDGDVFKPCSGSDRFAIEGGTAPIPVIAAVAIGEAVLQPLPKTAEELKAEEEERQAEAERQAEKARKELEERKASAAKFIQNAGYSQTASALDGTVTLTRGSEDPIRANDIFDAKSKVEAIDCIQKAGYSLKTETDGSFTVTKGGEEPIKAKDIFSAKAKVEAIVVIQKAGYSLKTETDESLMLTKEGADPIKAKDLAEAYSIVEAINFMKGEGYTETKADDGSIMWTKQRDHCPAGHRLEPVQGRGGWVCDGCAKSSSGGATRYHCDTCDYDVCDGCYQSQEQIKESDPRKAKEFCLKRKAEVDAELRRRPPGPFSLCCDIM